MKMYEPPSQKVRNAPVHIFNQVCWLIYFLYLGQLQILPLHDLFLNIPNFTYVCNLSKFLLYFFIHTLSQNSISCSDFHQ